jgi:hypothetical protein
MSAVQDAARQRTRGARGNVFWPWRSPLFDEPIPLIAYVTGVFAAYLGFIAWAVSRTPVTVGDVTLFGGLMCCGAVCVEATRRLGEPIGVWRDLLSAWWLPVALLLPPLYALVAPAVLGLLSYVRVHRGAVYRRVFSSAALGLSGASACSPRRHRKARSRRHWPTRDRTPGCCTRTRRRSRPPARSPSRC